MTQVEIARRFLGCVEAIGVDLDAHGLESGGSVTLRQVLAHFYMPWRK